MDTSSGVLHPANFVYLAAGVQVLGYLLRDQVKLRLLLLCGTFFYVLYYALAATTPLWDAILASSVLGLANLVDLSSLLLSRSAWLIPAEQRPLFEMLGGVQPGDFRALMKFGTMRTAGTEEEITRLGETPDRLFYISAGEPRVVKAGGDFMIPPRCFIGEVSLMLGAPASATVRLPAGAEFVEWPRETLARAMRRNHRLKLALEALMAEDMARKVAFSSGAKVAAA
jgi:hypothetical protein